MGKRDERYVAPEEYLAFEGSVEGKHEYFDGRIYAMSGATLNHASPPLRAVYEPAATYASAPA